MRILLIEDDLVAARGVILMLKASGAVVDHADTGEEGLELARHYDYDIVVLDLMLPDIEGFEVVRRMRVSRIDTPVLILSGLSRPQVKVKGLGLGADDFITKPFDKADAGYRAAQQGVQPADIAHRPAAAQSRQP
jgi:two-component system cell cycle response regulator CtrA